jgi:hypothetical protein
LWLDDEAETETEKEKGIMAMSTTPAAGSAAGAAGRDGPTQRTWWEATRDRWAHPAEWSIWNIVILFAGVVVLTIAAIWVTRPGSALGGAAPLEASLRYSDETAARYVYVLQEPPAAQARMQATLQSIYDAHKAAAAGKDMTIVLLRRAADASPFITGAKARFRT